MEEGNRKWRELVCRETARMSWPNRMVGGKKPLLKAKHLVEGKKVRTKDYVEKFFVEDFDLDDLRAKPANEDKFDYLHWQCVERLTNRLNLKNLNGTPEENQLTAISAKLVNTFFHQLMKYDDFRHFWCFLHLPLDQRIFTKLKNLDFKGKNSIIEIIKDKSPYAIDKSDYHAVQKSLWSLIEKINEEGIWGRTLTSRIELNLLWI